MSAMDRKRARPHRVQAFLLFRVAVRINPGVFGMKNRGGRRILQILRVAKILPLHTRGFEIRLKNIRPIVYLVRNNIRIVVRYVRRLTLRLVPRVFV